MIDNNRQRYATMDNERMKAKKNPGMTFERFIEAVMACEIVLRDYYRALSVEKKKGDARTKRQTSLYY